MAWLTDSKNNEVTISELEYIPVLKIYLSKREHIMPLKIIVAYLFVMLPMGCSSILNTAHTLTLNDVKFETESGVITKYVSNYKYIIIPEYLGDSPVTCIDNGSFYDKNLTSVIIPKSVTTIEQWAFGHNNLTSITIPKSITTIGNYAFYGNKLTNAAIPKSIIFIGKDVFDESVKITRN